MGSVTSLVIKVPEDQRLYVDGNTVNEYLNNIVNKLMKMAGGNSWPGSSLEVIDAGTYASGTFTIASGNLSANDTVTIGGQAITAKASGAVANEFNIGGTALLSAAACAAAINASSVLSKYCTATSAAGAASAGVVTITVSQPGPVGNAVTLAKSAANGAVSGTKLSGGNTGPITTVSF